MRKTCPACNSTKYSEIEKNVFVCARCHFVNNLNQYDEFLHKVQKNKMKELWDNKEDEDWENA
jgi:ribosomal protein L37AE/L43A